MAVNGSKEEMSSLDKKISQMEIDKKAQFENVGLLRKQIVPLVVGIFVGKWKYDCDNGNWRKYEGQFGRGFLRCLSISSIGESSFLFDLFHFI